MDIQLYKNFTKRKNSTKQPTGTYETKSVSLKQNTSIQNPVFLLTGFDNTYNYIYVPSWGRYYFIDDVVLGNTNLFEVHCSCDYLATFKSGISIYNCFVSRCSDSRYYNTDILDTALSVEDVVEHTASAVTNIFFGNSSYVVRMLGRGTTGIQSFVSDGLTFWGDIFNPLFNDPSQLSIDDVLTAFISDPSKYVLGVFYTPFNTGRMIGTEQQIYCGWYDTNKRAKALSNSAIYTDTKTLSKPTSIYSDFRKTDNAFSHYTLFLPGIGTVPLSADIMDSTLTLDVKCDQNTGDIIYQLKSDGSLVSSYNGNCYASLMIGNGDSSNGGNIIKTTGDLIGDAISGNIIGGVGDIVNGIRQNISPTPSFIGSQTGVAGVTFKDAIITVLQKQSAEFPLSVYGKPCCKNLTLGNLTGYIKCDNASIDLPGHGGDKDKINSYLNSGFYYE